jgi:hypothetical protein
LQKHGNGLVDFLYIRLVIFNSTFDQNLTSSKGPAYETVFRELKCATFHPDCSFKPPLAQVDIVDGNVCLFREMTSAPEQECSEP